MLFQSNLRKQIRNLPKILNFVRIIHYYSKSFTGVLKAHSLLLARERSLKQAVDESVRVHEAFLKMKWGGGTSGLAGSGTGCADLKPFKDWDTDPRARFKTIR